MSGGIANHDGVARHPPTAHIPGGGPAGAECAGCDHFSRTARRAKQRGRCRLWAKFRGMADRYDPDYQANYAWWLGLQTISGKTPACKYFVPREEQH